MMLRQSLFNSTGENSVTDLKVAAGQKVAYVRMHWRKSVVNSQLKREKASSLANFTTELSSNQVDDFAAKAKGCDARGDRKQIVKEMEDLNLNQQKEIMAGCASNASACKEK